MGTGFKPMLAGKAEDLADLRYPVLVSPKLDGIRCIVMDHLAMSRKLKPIPNNFVQSQLCERSKALLAQLDGELMLDLPGSFSAVSSAVMSRDGEPDFTFQVFDWVPTEIDCPFARRHELLRELVADNADVWPRLRVVEHLQVDSEVELLDAEQCALEAGFEGLMIRSLDGPYKYGRSTAKEGFLLKLKRFEDAEATIVGFEELMHNENEATTNELGLTKRSSAKAGKTAGGTLGKLKCQRPDGVVFGIGSGFTEAQRAELWESRAGLRGLVAKYKFQPNPAAPTEAPRFPVFLGLRAEID